MWIKTKDGHRVDTDLFDLYHKTKTGEEFSVVFEVQPLDLDDVAPLRLAVFSSTNEATVDLALQLIDEALAEGKKFLDIAVAVKGSARMAGRTPWGYTSD